MNSTPKRISRGKKIKTGQGGENLFCWKIRNWQENSAGKFTHFSHFCAAKHFSPIADDDEQAKAAQSVCVCGAGSGETSPSRRKKRKLKNRRQLAELTELAVIKPKPKVQQAKTQKKNAVEFEARVN